jgi:hypothetical protein
VGTEGVRPERRAACDKDGLMGGKCSELLVGRQLMCQLENRELVSSSMLVKKQVALCRTNSLSDSNDKALRCRAQITNEVLERVHSRQPAGCGVRGSIFLHDTVVHRIWFVALAERGSEIVQKECRKGMYVKAERRNGEKECMYL